MTRGEEGTLEIFVAVAHPGEPPEHPLGRAATVGALAVRPVLVGVVVGEPTRVCFHEFGPALRSLEVIVGQLALKSATTVTFTQTLHFIRQGSDTPDTQTDDDIVLKQVSVRYENVVRLLEFLGYQLE